MNYTTIFVNDQPIEVEVADTLQKQIHGLKHRTSLDHNKGMLFVFEKEDYYSMCMNDTLIPLSVAFFNKDGLLVNIEDMLPLSDRQYYSKEKVKYALEMNIGWFNQFKDTVILNQTTQTPEM